MTSTVAYLINVYPAISHTFIRREINSLETHGIEVVRISLRRPSGDLPDKSDERERSRTRYVLAGGVRGLLGSLIHVAIRTPRRLVAALGLTLAMARGSDRPWPVHLVYLAEACVIKSWLGEIGAVHLHAHFATNSAEIAMLVRMLGGPPYSFTAHGSDIADRPAQIGLPLTVGAAKFVVAVCAYGRSQICKWVSDLYWPRIQVVRCGLEQSYGSAMAEAQPPHGNQLVCIGRLAREKGQLVLIEAAALLRDRGLQFRLVLVGDGPMRRRVEERLSELGLCGQVRLMGALDAAGVQAEILASRALVVPSLSEGLPVVIMEAMALGRPVVAPYLAGIPELVRHGRNGWLFPAADTEVLATTLAECLGTAPNKLVEMSDRAKRDVSQAHDVDRETGKLANLILATDQPWQLPQRHVPATVECGVSA